MANSGRLVSWQAVVAIFTLSFALLVSASSPGKAAQNFSDVPPGASFYREIVWLAQSGISTGFTDGTFRPKQAVTREQMAGFLYRLEGRPAVSGGASFSDVKPGASFYNEIMWLSQAGISTGFTDGTFRPKQAVTREQMAGFLYRLEGRPAVSGGASFSDVKPGASFYNEIMWLSQAGISTGFTDGTFRPKQAVTREQMSGFLYRIAGRPHVDLPKVIPDSFTISGAGWGHGVGMSQYGAQGMAVEGYSAEQILTHYFKGTKLASHTIPELIKVEIFGSGSDDRNQVDLVVNGDWRLKFTDVDRGLHTTWEGKSGEKLHVVRSGNSVRVTRDGGVSQAATNHIELNWENTEYYKSSSNKNTTAKLLRPGTNSTAANGTYRHGRIYVNVPSETSPRLIAANQLKFNTEYLYGIAEVPSSWSMEALKAQAIVARSYAMRTVNYRAACNCHIWDDARHQNFTGWNKENEGNNAQWGKRWVSAVNATNSGARTGTVLKYGTNIAQTYYFSSSGGRTENSNHIWQADLPYLKSVDDRWSLEAPNPNRAWTRTMSQAQARSIFGLSDVVSIEVTKRTANSSQAAASTVTATSFSGEKSSITGPDKIRNRVVGGHSPWIWSFTPNF